MAKGTKAPAKKQTKKSQSPDALRQFRHDVAILKKKGLVSKRVDARSVKPTKAMLAKTKEFRDVIDGKSVVWHVKKRADFYAMINAGERGANQHVVLKKGEYLYKGVVAYKEGDDEADGKKRRKVRKTSHQTFEEYIDMLAANLPLKEGQGYYFKFYGNKSGDVFFDVQELKAYLFRYGTVKHYIQKLIASKAHKELAENTELGVEERDGYRERRGPLVAPKPGYEGRSFREHVPGQLKPFEKKRTRKTKRQRVKGK